MFPLIFSQETCFGDVCKTGDVCICKQIQGFAWEHSTCAKDQHQGLVMKIKWDGKKN